MKKPNDTVNARLNYDSMAQAAAASGVPLSAFRHAKRNGCTAFRHSRVDLRGFLAWWFSQDEEGSENWKGRRERASALREEIRLEEDQKRTIDRGLVVDAIAGSVSKLRSALDRVFLSELPAALKGADEQAIKLRNRAALDVAFAEMQERFASLAQAQKEAQ